MRHYANGIILQNIRAPNKYCRLGLKFQIHYYPWDNKALLVYGLGGTWRSYRRARRNARWCGRSWSPNQYIHTELKLETYFSYSPNNSSKFKVSVRLQILNFHNNMAFGEIARRMLWPSFQMSNPSPSYRSYDPPPATDDRTPHSNHRTPTTLPPLM